MRVRAKQLIFFGNRRVRAGEEIDMPDHIDPGAAVEILEGPAAPQPWQTPAARTPKPGSLPALAQAVGSLHQRVQFLEATLAGLLADRQMAPEPRSDSFTVPAEPEPKVATNPEDKAENAPTPSRPRRGKNS